MMYKWLLLIITQPHLTLKNLFSNFDIAYLLSEGLCLNCGLKELALNGFDITAHGVIILAKALEHHCTLVNSSLSAIPKLFGRWALMKFLHVLAYVHHNMQH